MKSAIKYVVSFTNLFLNAHCYFLLRITSFLLCRSISSGISLIELYTAITVMELQNE